MSEAFSAATIVTAAAGAGVELSVGEGSGSLKSIGIGVAPDDCVVGCHAAPSTGTVTNPAACVDLHAQRFASS